jgi:pimeloyl-ACP methyl ester carboxylesterase
MYYKQIGDENGPLFVFIHGAHTNHESMGKIANRFTEYNCIVPDLPEHGKSTEGGVFSIKDSIEFINELIEKKRFDKEVIILGLSLGAIIVRRYLVEYPDKVDLAILGSGTIYKRIGYYIDANKCVVNYTYLRNPEYFKHINLSKSNYIEESKELLRYANIDTRITNISIPILLLSGSKEPKFIIKSGMVLSKNFLNSEHKMIPEAKHCYNNDNTESLYRIIESFLKRYINRN